MWVKIDPPQLISYPDPNKNNNISYLIFGNVFDGNIYLFDIFSSTLKCIDKYPDNIKIHLYNIQLYYINILSFSGTFDEYQHFYGKC